MTFKATNKKHTLDFKFNAGTSRGVLTSHDVWFVKLFNTEDRDMFGLGEAAPLAGLSVDHRPDFDSCLGEVCNQVSTLTGLEDEEIAAFINSIPHTLPSIRMAFEMALFDLQNGGRRTMGFSAIPQEPISINGLIWMGDEQWMLDQIEQKLEAGFTCLKLKIGAIDFEKECAILDFIRSRFTKEQITLRVDANGAFSIEEAYDKLRRLSTYDLHSIEQPIKAGQTKAMESLCRQTPLPIALDEELIGIHKKAERGYLLDSIQPQYIILKPSLIGGFASTREWIQLAEDRDIGWWITSALESNLGLAAIAEFASSYKVSVPQGLGTGQLYNNNLMSPLYIKKGYLHRDPQNSWELNSIE